MFDLRKWLEDRVNEAIPQQKRPASLPATQRTAPPAQTVTRQSPQIASLRQRDNRFNAVDQGLASRQSWEDISKNTGVELARVRAYSKATRPDYGIKKPQVTPLGAIQGAANEVGQTLKAGFMAKGGIGDSANKFNEGVGQSVRDIRQAIPRAVKSFGLDARKQQTYSPQGAAEKWLYGDRSIKNSEGVGSDALGVIGKNQNPIINRAAGTVLNALDVSPIGHAGSKVIETAPKVAEAAAPLIKAGAKQVVNAVDQAGIPKNSALRVPFDERRALEDFVDMRQNRIKTTDSEKNEIIKRAYEIGDKYGLHLYKGRNGEVQDEVAGFLDNLSRAREYAKQGGYAKMPFKESGEVDISPAALEHAHSTNKPEEIATQAVDYWYKHGKETKGGQLINTGDDQYKRISEHNQFYSDFVKQNKRAPSKVDYQTEVTRQLENGGGSMVSPDEANAYQLVKAREKDLDNLAKSGIYDRGVNDVSVAPSSIRSTQPGKASQLHQLAQGQQPNRSSLPEGQNLTLPDNTAQIDRSSSQFTPDVTTEQYVKQMQAAQKNAQKGGSKLKTFTTNAKAEFIDDLAPIEDRLNKAIKSGAKVDPKDHITYQLDRSRRSEGITQAYIKDNSLDKIIQNVPDANAFDQYLIARHAKELDEGVKTGRNAAQDAQLVNDLDATYAPYAKEIYKYNQKLLDTSVEYGLISRSAAAALKKKYPEYVPFNRIFNEEELAALHGGTGKADASLSQQSAVKKIKGSTREISSPLNSIIDKTRIVIEQGERNKAAQMLASYKDLPGNPFNLKEIPKNETIGSRHTISFLDNGNKRTFEVDPDIAEAAKHMSREDIGFWGRMAAIPARVLRSGATSANVGFAGANVVKDVVGSAINSAHPFRILDPRNFGKALAAALHHNGKYYQELMREGVAGTSFDMYRNPLKSNVGEIRSQKNIATRAMYNARPDRWFKTLENTIGRSEDFGRALQYYSNKAGYLAENKSDEVARILAGDQARSNATNFFRSGTTGKNVNLAIPYWNAGVQGARIQVRRLKERPAQTLGKIGLAIAAPSAMIAMNNYADPKKAEVMGNIPDYEKEGNIIIVGNNARLNPETGAWEDVYKIPVPPQHIGIHNTIQNAVRAGLTGEAFDTLGNLGKIAENYTTLNPTSLSDTASKYVPQALKLVAEPISNTNFFTGNKIVPDSQKNLPAPDQYNDYTSGVAKVTGRLFNQSPRVIDNAIRTGLGGAGQNVVNAVDTGLAAVGAIEPSEVKGKNLPDSIVSRFYGPKAINPSEKSDKQFSDLRKQVIESEAYKAASPYDKSRMLNRLQEDLEKVAYNEAGKNDDKLTKKQKALAESGFNVDTYTNLDSKSSGVSDLPEKLKSNKNVQNIYRELDKMNGEEKKAWRTGAANGNSQELIKAARAMLPAEFPDFPQNNGVAEDYVDFLKRQETGKWSELQTQKEMSKFVKGAYESQFDDSEKFIRTLSDADLLDAVNAGQVPKATLDKIISVDDILVELGMTPAVGKKARASLGYHAQPTKVRGSGKATKAASRSRGGGKKGKFDYKLFGFSGASQSNSKQLYDLLKKAKMRYKEA